MLLLTVHVVGVDGIVIARQMRVCWAAFVAGFESQQETPMK